MTENFRIGSQNLCCFSLKGNLKGKIHKYGANLDGDNVLLILVGIQMVSGWDLHEFVWDLEFEFSILQHCLMLEGPCFASQAVSFQLQIVDAWFSKL